MPRSQDQDSNLSRPQTSQPNSFPANPSESFWLDSDSERNTEESTGFQPGGRSSSRVLGQELLREYPLDTNSSQFPVEPTDPYRGFPGHFRAGTPSGGFSQTALSVQRGRKCIFGSSLAFVPVRLNTPIVTMGDVEVVVKIPQTAEGRRQSPPAHSSI